MNMRLLKYNKNHDKIFKSSGYTLDDVLNMNDDEKNEFIHKYVVKYIVDNIDGLEDEAEDVIDMIKYWEPGQTEEEIDDEYLPYDIYQ